MESWLDNIVDRYTDRQMESWLDNKVDSKIDR